MGADQSLISLFWNASFIVKIVMLILLSASIVSWALIFQRWKVFAHAQKINDDFEDTFWSGVDLGKLYQRFATPRAEISGAVSIFVAGFKEFMRLRKQAAEPSAIMEGAERAMRVAMSRETNRLEAHLPFLATVGSVSPYIGLFGTVWGIMNSMRALGSVQQASLQMVAPGIAEALIATAIGLFAAIPAVIAYNRYSNLLQSLLNNYATFLEEFSSILHRQAHMHQPTGTSLAQSPQTSTSNHPNQSNSAQNNQSQASSYFYYGSPEPQSHSSSTSHKPYEKPYEPDESMYE